MSENKPKRQVPFQISGCSPEDIHKFNSYAARRGIKRSAFLKYLIDTYGADAGMKHTW